MTIDEENRRNILSNIPNGLLQTKDCKLNHSFISSTSTAAWRHLDYREQYDLNSIHISITHKINNSYYAIIKVYISGTCYDYYRAPRVRTFTDVTSNFARVDIDFLRGNTCIGFIRVYGNNTIDPAFPEEYERNTTYKCYSKCFKAMEQVIAYLEILGFKNDR